MLEEAGSDCWLPRSGHWIIMEEADIMAGHQTCTQSGSSLDAIYGH